MSILKNPHVSFDYAGLFDTDRPWIHPERIEKTYELICVTKGTVYITEEERQYTLKKGDLLLLSPNVRHYGSKTSESAGFYWLHFHISGGALPFSQRHFEGFESITLFKELLHYNNLPHIPTALVNAILLHILCDLANLSEENRHRYDSKFEKIYEWIRINAAAELKVSTAASALGYSPDHLTRLCRQYCGMGARELINHFLLVRAKALLCNTDKYVKEIAGELGFSGDKAFIGYFKYHEGCFPTKFRARFAKTHMNNK